MRFGLRLVAVMALCAIFVAATACSQPVLTPTPVSGVVVPFPEEGNQYRMSEVCEHLQAKGYEVKGTLTHEFGAESFEDLLEAIPSLARGPVENYLGEGLRVEVEIRSLCEALNE